MNDYLNKQIDNPFPRLLESETINSILEELGYTILGDRFNSKIFVMNVYTKQLYPRFIKSDNSYTILWDSHFWDMYGRFLFPTMFYVDANCDTGFLKEYYTSLLLLILSTRFNSHPGLSYLLAKEYSNNFPLVPPYNTGDDIEDILLNVNHISELQIGKMYAFSHEMYHIKFRNQPSERDLLFKKIRQLLTAYQDLLALNSELDPLSVSEEDKLTQAFFSNLLNDSSQTLFEEFCCDTFSIITLYHYFKNKFDGDMDEVKYALSKIRYLTLFTVWVSSSESFWDSLRKVYLNPVKYDTAFVDPKSDFYRFGDKINSELCVRFNLTWSIASDILYDSLSEFDYGNRLPSTVFFNSQRYDKEFRPALEGSLIIKSMEEILQQNKWWHDRPIKSYLKTAETNCLIGWGYPRNK